MGGREWVGVGAAVCGVGARSGWGRGWGRLGVGGCGRGKVWAGRGRGKEVWAGPWVGCGKPPVLTTPLSVSQHV